MKQLNLDEFAIDISPPPCLVVINDTLVELTKGVSAMSMDDLVQPPGLYGAASRLWRSQQSRVNAFIQDYEQAVVKVQECQTSLLGIRDWSRKHFEFVRRYEDMIKKVMERHNLSDDRHVNLTVAQKASLSTTLTIIEMANDTNQLILKSINHLLNNAIPAWQDTIDPLIEAAKRTLTDQSVEDTKRELDELTRDTVEDIDIALSHVHNSHKLYQTLKDQ